VGSFEFVYEGDWDPHSLGTGAGHINQVPIEGEARMRSLIPWRESHLVEEARKEFDDAFRRFFGASFELNGNGKTTWTPHVDVTESDKSVVVKADLPGVDAKDVEITIEDGVLTLKGEKKEEREEKQKNYRRMERFVGTFYRAIPLPTGMDDGNVTANSAKGVITITVPKKPSAQPKKVAVKVGE
jgi:HSP20 family protein